MPYSRRPQGLNLALGGTGKTGRLVASRLEAIGRPVRIGSRRATPAFDWTREGGWDACLKDVNAIYISYASDLVATDGATEPLAVLLTVLVYGSFGLARLLGMPLDGTPSTGIVAATVIELIVAAVGLRIMGRQPGGGSSRRLAEFTAASAARWRLLPR